MKCIIKNFFLNITKTFCFFFSDSNDQRVFEIIKGDLRHTRPECCPEEIYDHALSCWSKDPDARVTFEFISHFFNNYDICTEPRYDEVKEVDEDEYVCQ